MLHVSCCTFVLLLVKSILLVMLKSQFMHKVPKPQGDWLGYAPLGNTVFDVIGRNQDGRSALYACKHKRGLLFQPKQSNPPPFLAYFELNLSEDIAPACMHAYRLCMHDGQRTSVTTIMAQESRQITACSRYKVRRGPCCCSLPECRP